MKRGVIGGIYPPILKIINYIWVFSSTPQPLGVPHNQSEYCGGKKPLKGIEPGTTNHFSRSLRHYIEWATEVSGKTHIEGFKWEVNSTW